MIPSLQKITIIVLALLQLAAPLVHAHSHPDSVETGLHVPGLEALAIGIDVDSISSLKSPQQSEQYLLSISTGIESRLTTDVDSDRSMLFALVALLVFIRPGKPLLVSPRNSRLSKRRLHYARPESRAPPAFHRRVNPSKT